MFNLVRMDLYRLIRSKSVYICLACLMAASILCFWMVWMIETPEGRTAASKIGMSALSGPEEEGSMIEGYDTLMMFRDIGMDGGAYVCILGIATVLFVCMDYNSGFLKNILSLHRRRWTYVCSKLITVGILNFCYLVILYAFCLLLNVIFHNLVPIAGAADTLFYLTQSWVAIMAFLALFLLSCIFTRSASGSITIVILLSSGLLVTLLGNFTGLFGWNEWVKYTIYFNQAYMPSTYSSLADLKGFAIGAVFLVLYSGAAMAVLSKRDV